MLSIRISQVRKMGNSCTFGQPLLAISSSKYLVGTFSGLDWIVRKQTCSRTFFFNSRKSGKIESKIQIKSPNVRVFHSSASFFQAFRSGVSMSSPNPHLWKWKRFEMKWTFFTGISFSHEKVQTGCPSVHISEVIRLKAKLSSIIISIRKIRAPLEVAC